MAAGNIAQSKVVLVGDSGVGKTAIVNRLVKNDFVEDAEPTIGAAFVTQNITLPKGVVRLDVWDTAGQERYRSLAPMYYRGAQAAVVVFAVNVRESFEAAKKWVKELQRKAEAGIYITLAANKMDLPKDEQRVDLREAQEYAREEGLAFYQCSAKSGHRVRDIFVEIAGKVPQGEGAARASILEEQAPPPAKCC